jgi:hypothetical protein
MGKIEVTLQDDAAEALLKAFTVVSNPYNGTPNKISVISHMSLYKIIIPNATLKVMGGNTYVYIDEDRGLPVRITNIMTSGPTNGDKRTS